MIDKYAEKRSTHNLFVLSMLKKDSALLFQRSIFSKRQVETAIPIITQEDTKITLLLLTTIPLYHLKENLGLQI